MPLKNLLILPTLILGIGLAKPCFAVLQFQKEFYEIYNIDKKAEEKTDFAKAVLEAKCYLCHQGKKSKKNRNCYGQEMSKLLDAKKDKKDKEKIAAAIQKVAKLHTDPKDEKSPTYGDLIKAGKLPCGPLEEAKKEPEPKEGTEDDMEVEKPVAPKPEIE